MRTYRKHDYPVSKIRRFLEPGPVVLLTTFHQGQRDIMAMGWHLMLGFSPALVGCYIDSGNHSSRLARRSRQCVINLPTVELLDTVVRIGNSSGAQTDKFDAYALTAEPGALVAAPLIRECYASFECRLVRATRDNFFVWECVQAHVARRPTLPQTMHYRGNGEFMLSGPTVSRRRLFKPEML